MVLDHQGEYPSQWAAIGSVAEKLGVHRKSLRLWVRRAETDAGACPGLSTDERDTLKRLEKENKELRRANEMELEAERNFRLVRSCKKMPSLVAALRRHTTDQTVTPNNHDQAAA